MTIKTLYGEQLAWELPRIDADIGHVVPPDETLLAYREGRLSELERRRVEWLLSRSARARGRLVQLAGVEPARPPARIRRRVLGGARSTYWKVAAALLALALTGSLGWFLSERGGTAASLRRAALPADLEYEVSVVASAATRSPAESSRADARTRVRIFVEPRRHPVAGLEFGVYRVDASQVKRLRPGVEVDVAADRGAAALEAEAVRLVGAEPGTRDFFVVIAPQGSLPPGGALDGREPAEWLASASGGRVYRRSLTVLAGESGGGSR